MKSDCLSSVPGAAIRNCGQAPRKANVLSPTHSPHPTPRALRGWRSSHATRQELSRSTPESGRLLGKRVLLSRSARVGRQSAWAGHQHGCRAFVLEPVSSGPKKDTDTDLGTHPQPSRDGYLRPEPGGLQSAAKRKHVGGTELLREKRAQRDAPSGCLVADSHNLPPSATRVQLRCW